MKLLELFSGTGSVGRVARDLGFSVISLDLKNADVNQDMLCGHPLHAPNTAGRKRRVSKR